MVELKEDLSPKALEKRYQDNLNLCCENDEALSSALGSHADASTMLCIIEGVQFEQDLMFNADGTYNRFKDQPIYCARTLVYVLEFYPYF